MEHQPRLERRADVPGVGPSVCPGCYLCAAYCALCGRPKDHRHHQRNYESMTGVDCQYERMPWAE